MTSLPERKTFDFIASTSNVYVYTRTAPAFAPSPANPCSARLRGTELEHITAPGAPHRPASGRCRHALAQRSCSPAHQSVNMPIGVWSLARDPTHSIGRRRIAYRRHIRLPSARTGLCRSKRWKSSPRSPHPPTFTPLFRISLTNASRIWGVSQSNAMNVPSLGKAEIRTT